MTSRNMTRPPGRPPKIAGPGSLRPDSEEPARYPEQSYQDADDDLEDREDEEPIHASRDAEFPSDEPLHDDLEDWTPPAVLEAPPPRPGFVQRWVRFRRGSQEDVRNFQRQRQVGWQPRDPRTVPGGWRPPTGNHGDVGSCIMVEGLILCEMAASRKARRDAYYQKITARQMQGVEEQLLKAQQPGHPIDHRATTRVTVGGRRPLVQDDDAA